MHRTRFIALALAALFVAAGAGCTPRQPLEPIPGILIGEVMPGSSAAGENIAAGDRIAEAQDGANLRPVASQADLISILTAKRQRGEKALLLVHKDGRPRFVALDLSADSFGGIRLADTEPARQIAASVSGADATGIDQSCILASGNELRRLLKLEATAGRARPVPPGRDLRGFRAGREVELDTVNTGIPVTYMFLCMADERGRAFASPLGRKAS